MRQTDNLPTAHQSFCSEPESPAGQRIDNGALHASRAHQHTKQTLPSVYSCA